MNSPLLARLARNYGRAGDLYYREGRVALAAQMYEKAGMKAEAARLYAESGDTAAAVRLLVEVGDRREAARLLEKGGQLREAIAQYEGAGALWEAAELASKARMPGVAARLYERTGAFEKAAAAFEQASEIGEAVRVLEREVKRFNELLRTRSGDGRTRTDLRKAELHRAELFAKLKQVDDAIEIFERHGANARVAELHEAAGRNDRAAIAYLQAGLAERALKLVAASTLGCAERAKIYRANRLEREAAEAFEEAGLFGEAAECFEAAGLPARAASLWERAGELKRAADLYFREKRWADAERCFTIAGDLVAAVSAALAGGNLGRAAELQLETEQFLESGQNALAAGRDDLALEALQRIPATHLDFERATLLLVPILIEDGMHSVALARLEMLSESNDRTGPVRVERTYWEARALEAAGRHGEAARAYEQTVALNRAFRDATTRLKSIKERGDTGERPVAGATVRFEQPAPTPLAVGATLAGRYDITREIGHGGMARVYEAFDRELKEPVAIKTLLVAHGSVALDEERLLREVQISRRITHPNVVRVYDLGRFPGGVFVTMELLRGRGLDAIIREHGALPLLQVRTWALAIASGLVAAHRLKVVHRDLKPANIFIEADGTPKVLDFGIARADDQDVGLTSTGEVMGSPMYMAPEQLCGEPIDGRTDLYALGVLLFAATTGHEPFQGKTASAIALKHLQETPQDPRELRGDLPDAWAELILRLLRKKPADRLEDASVAGEAIAALPV